MADCDSGISVGEGFFFVQEEDILKDFIKILEDVIFDSDLEDNYWSFDIRGIY